MTFRRLCFATLVVVALAASTATAFARTRSAPGIALHQPAGAAAAKDWQPAVGDLVTFDDGYSSNIKNPRIEVLCYQNGTLVYGEAGSADQAFQQSLTGYPGFILGGSSSLWLSSPGPAECVANLFYFGSHAGVQTYNLLASTKFSAG